MRGGGGSHLVSLINLVVMTACQPVCVNMVTLEEDPEKGTKSNLLLFFVPWNRKTAK